jgi:hypothetical protein
MSEDSMRDAENGADAKQPPQPEHFAFFMEDHDIVERLIAAVRLLLHRKTLTPIQAHRVAIVLLALERLPLSTKGVEISLSFSHRINDELSYQALYIGETVFELQTGGSVYSPGVGGDNYADNVFVVELGNRRNKVDLLTIDGWLEGFSSEARDEGTEIEFEWLGDESQIDWENEEPTRQYWDNLESEHT